MKEAWVTALSNPRLWVFLSVFLCCALLEALYPRRNRLHARRVRWPHNFGLLGINAIVGSFLFPLIVIGCAVFGQHHRLGLLHHFNFPSFIKIGLGLVLMDLVIYWSHVLSHKIDFLWRFHQVHHTDQDLDVTSGTRFHTLEIVISFFWKALFVLLLGISAQTVLVFEILLNANAVFNHSNIRIPPRLDRWMRLIWITPDMHRIHHSIDRFETNTNFGFQLSLWDRIFGTYLQHPCQEHVSIELGVISDNGTKAWVQNIKDMMLWPFRR